MIFLFFCLSSLLEQMLIILYPQFLAQGAKNLAYGTPLSPPMSMAERLIIHGFLSH